MRTATIIGIILIMLGVIGFVLGGISFTHEKKVADVGPLELNTEKKETVAIPPILSGISVIGGIALVIAGSRKRL